MTSQPTIDVGAAVDAIAHLLARIEAEYRNPHRPRDFKQYTIADLPTAVDELIRDPVRHACGRALTDVGRHLHANAVDMETVAEQVWSRAPRRDRARWVSSLTVAWSGIGDWQS